MNIDDLTLGQIKSLTSLFTQTKIEHAFTGKYVICRCFSAGVHAGTLVSCDKDEVILKNSRRIWSWKTKAGIALSGLSQYGLESGKVDSLVPDIGLTGVIEIIPCSKFAEDTIHGAK